MMKNRITKRMTITVTTMAVMAVPAKKGMWKTITLAEKIEKHRKQLRKQKPDTMLQSKNSRTCLIRKMHSESRNF